MIEINLVPDNLRKRKKQGVLSGASDIPTEVVVGIGGGFLVLLIIIHLLLLTGLFIKKGKLSWLEKKWEELQPAKTNVDVVVSELRDTQAKIKAIRDVTEGKDYYLSEKLETLSNSLPRGIWLKKVELTSELFVIEGSAISKENLEMISVHELTTNLNSDKNFLKGFTELELGSIQRRMIHKVEVADFLMTAEVKQE